MSTPQSWAARSWATLDALRQSSPLVHNITNYVAMEISANTLLAIGASPAMIHAVEEAADFASIASAVVINIGTLSPRWVEGMHGALDAARAKGTPTVLDPVGVGATPYRTGVAAELAKKAPTVIRANASEMMALAAACGVGEQARGKGVDATHSTDQALASAKALARELGVICAMSGEVDRITDGERILSVANGHAMLTRVTAMGCSLSGVVGACLAVEPDALAATAAAFGVFGLAGQRAATEAQGPGSLKAHLLDALYTLDEATVLDGVKISEG